MLLSALAAGLAALPVAPALARQVPHVNGIYGGSPDQFEVTSTQTTFGAATTDLLRVTENSGVCETTPDVYQASGYGNVSSTGSLWFWFFEARSNPDTAPLTIWLNGGPGSSSMVGLFDEHGPCRLNNDSTALDYNPYSWNNVSNIPVGVGFSYGDQTVGTTQEAAADVWTFLQLFLNDTRFSKYQENEFAIWTESYGGHYGPAFAAHFLQQNDAIANGSITGTPLNLKYLGVGDGLTDPLSQYPGYIEYASENPYHPTVSQSTVSQASTAWNESGGCKDQITACYNGGSDDTCSTAQYNCNNDILSPLSGDYDVYYILAEDPDAYPPDPTDFLNNATFQSQIGAEATWQETNTNVYSNFADTGDWMRNSRPDLEYVIDSGVRTIVFDGDADYILNFKGVEAMVAALQTDFSSEFNQLEFTNWTVNGEPAGLYKNAGTFSYVRIFGAGHEVAAYDWGNLARGEAALQMFSQIMSNSSISST
ncbi:serine carboxypeptidase [Fomitopsis serialis]|uniref:serine carboxypeptidase n=1 Tax=Fomitopsis serialis TaxID=139415 RepID=UPI002007B7DB|nr:serine carboxypeptidase [Neoantrodia serialis]KAH9915914.1 serine carboxypeptidase [Neoantrodia serialis]